MLAHAINLSTQEEKLGDTLMFEESLVYNVSSRTTRDTEGNPVWQNKIKQKQHKITGLANTYDKACLRLFIWISYLFLSFNKDKLPYLLTISSLKSIIVLIVTLFMCYTYNLPPIA